MNGIPHPVSLALARWDTLHLSEAQINRLREISDRLENTLFSLMVADTDAIYRMWRHDPIDSAAIERAAHSDVERSVRLTLELLRARDEVFVLLSSRQSTLLQNLFRNLREGSTDRGMEQRPCSGGSAGGSATLSDTAELVYSLTFAGDSARIDAVFVARADDKLFSSPGPPAARRGTASSGATAGRWWLSYDRRLNVATIDTLTVQLGQNNVILVQGIDRVTRYPDVVGLVRIRSTYARNGCGNKRDGERLKAHVLNSPEVRAFLQGKR